MEPTRWWLSATIHHKQPHVKLDWGRGDVRLSIVCSHGSFLRHASSLSIVCSLVSSPKQKLLSLKKNRSCWQLLLLTRHENKIDIVRHACLAFFSNANLLSTSTSAVHNLERKLQIRFNLICFCNVFLCLLIMNLNPVYLFRLWSSTPTDDMYFEKYYS
jgi:hypothetical protein